MGAGVIPVTRRRDPAEVHAQYVPGGLNRVRGVAVIRSYFSIAVIQELDGLYRAETKSINSKNVEK